MEARTLDALVAKITAAAETHVSTSVCTFGQSARHQLVGNLLWEVRKHTIGQGKGAQVWKIEILCHEIEGSDADGWTSETHQESDTLRHVSCPLEYFQLAWEPQSKAWRDRVWRHHEEKLTREIEAREAKEREQQRPVAGQPSGSPQSAGPAPESGEKRARVVPAAGWFLRTRK